MKAICIQIGNSDNKLTQEDWSNFVWDLDGEITLNGAQEYFTGGSENWAKWQNYCKVIGIDESKILRLKSGLSYLCKKYEQESIAYFEGDVEFIS